MTGQRGDTTRAYINSIKRDVTQSLLGNCGQIGQNVRRASPRVAFSRRDLQNTSFDDFASIVGHANRIGLIGDDLQMRRIARRSTFLPPTKLDFVDKSGFSCRRFRVSRTVETTEWQIRDTDTFGQQWLECVAPATRIRLR